MAIGPKGIDVRQTTGQLVFRAALKDAAGNLVTTGTTTLRLFEIQSDATLKIYDWNANTFGSTGSAPTTDGLALTHRTYKDQSNVTQNTGIWTGVLSTLTGFTAGGVYMAQVTNTGAAPAQQEREFQFGLVQGDDGLTATQKTDVLAALAGRLAAVMNDGSEGVNLGRVGFTYTGSGGVFELTDENGTVAVDGLLSAINEVVALIQAKTDNLPASPAQTGDAMALTAAYDLYHANIWFTQDSGNGVDEYTVTWFKNGVPLVAGVTAPKITVTIRSDGSALVPETAMTAFGTTGSFKYDSADPAVLADGDAALVVVSATIDASTRTFSKLIGRDG